MLTHKLNLKIGQTFCLALFIRLKHEVPVFNKIGNSSNSKKMTAKNVFSLSNDFCFDLPILSISAGRTVDHFYFESNQRHATLFT